MVWNKQIPSQITLMEMKAEIVREINVRRRVFPNWYESGKLSASVGEYRILVFEAVALQLDQLIDRNHYKYMLKFYLHLVFPSLKIPEKASYK